MSRWLIGSIGSGIWSCLVFAMGMMLFFPSEWIKDQIAYQVQTQTNKKMLVHIGEAQSSGIMGVELRDVSLYSSKRGRRVAGQTGSPPRENTLTGSVKSLSLSPDLIGLLSGTLGAALSVELEGGELGADVGVASSALKFSTDIEDFQLGAHPIKMDDTDVELSGLLSLISDITIDRDDIKGSAGEIELNIENLALKRGMVSGFELTETTFSQAILKMEVEDGKAKVTEGKFAGDLIDATIDGHITLRKDLSRSRLALKIRVRFDETLDKLASMMLKSSRDEEGLYHFKGQGTLMNPRFKPDRIKSRSKSRRSDEADEKSDYAAENDDRKTRTRRRSSSRGQTEAEREERRAKRQERLRKRRERMKQRREERRARQAETEGRDYEARDVRGQTYDDDQADVGFSPPPPPRALPLDQEDFGNQNDYGNANEYGNANDYADPNDNYRDGNFNNEEDYGDPNDPNGNLEDLGYIDE